MNHIKKHSMLRMVSNVVHSPLNACKDPSLDLQQYLETPIFREKCYSPSLKSVMEAKEFFVSKYDHRIKVLTRVADPFKFPDHELPEVAFLGRSNAGKSALLQALFEAVPSIRIRVSKKPGCTKSLNFYEVGKKLCLVDMPGYGHNQPKWFELLVNHYLEKRKNLLKLFLLIDTKSGIDPLDEQAIQNLEHLRVPYALVMTKIDKCPSSKRLRSLLHLQNFQAKISSVCCFPQVFMLSSHTKEGLEYFMSFIAHISGNLNVEDQ